MNCLIYLRVSTQEQAKKSSDGESYSILAQREACLKTIQENGWNFVDEFVDRGFSARSIRRPSLQELLSRIKKDQTIEAVVVHKLDRLARNMEDHVAIRAILRKHNIQLVSVTENLEDTASGRLVEGIHALMAEFYSANLASETLKGMGQKAKQGGCPHHAPLGYKHTREVVKGREIRSVAIDDKRALFIKEAFKLYSTGNYSLAELREMLTKKGLRTRPTPTQPGKIISVGVLASLLQNKFYIGLVKYKGVKYPGIHKPLISKDLFTRVQEVLRLHNLAGERKRKHPHYLKETLFCGECGSKLSIDLAKEKFT